MINEPGTVWSQVRHQSGVYDCRVERDGDGGKLSVTLVGTVNHVLHEENVKVDTADLDAWRRRCVEVITKPELRKFVGV